MKSLPTKTLEVQSATFIATLQFRRGVVNHASPCLMWMMGRTEADAKRIMAMRGWTWQELTNDAPGSD